MPSLNCYLAPILETLHCFFDECSLANEHQIIKHLQNQKIAPFNEFSLAESKDLFHAHFLCMHGLYHLKQHYFNQQNFNLIIELTRVERVTLDTLLIVEDGSNCAVEIADPLASYYLDSTHYFETNEEEINGLLKSFWQKYLSVDNKKAALDVLELPIDADATMVKSQYLRLAKKHHPDKGGCAKMFNKISQAKTDLDKIL